MIITHYEQGEDVWLRSKLGVLSASVIGQAVTTKGKKSASWKKLLFKLAAERITGKIEEGFKSKWMERGNEVEHRGREVFEFMLDAEVHETGLIYKDDDKRVGCSPDGLVELNGELGGIEIKSPSPAVHLEYLVAGKLPTIYFGQVQFSMWVTGLKWWFFVSNHDDFKPLILKIEPDEEYFKALDLYVPNFIDEMDCVCRAGE